MSSIDRPLSGDVLRFRLQEERERVNDPALLERHGRSARTLLKEGSLRVTLVMVRAGGHIAAHRAGGPITVSPDRTLELIAFLSLLANRVQGAKKGK